MCTCNGKKQRIETNSQTKTQIYISYIDICARMYGIYSRREETSNKNT